MSVPAYLSCSYRFKETGMLTDVADIITTFRDEVLNQNNPAWTEPVAGTFRSPVDAAGRYIEVSFTRIAATNLELHMADSQGLDFGSGRMQLPAAPGAKVWIATGQFYFHIETVVVTNVEWARGGILDLSPEAQNAHPKWSYFACRRSTADVVEAYTGNAAFKMQDNNAMARTYRCSSPFSAVGGPDMTPSGGYIFSAINLHCQPTGGGDTRKLVAGRLYQHLFVADNLAIGGQMVVPLDAGSYGTFKALGIDVNSLHRHCVRIA